MNQRDLVSVIIPVYNMENTIGALLEDVERQTYKNLEIIIVNDGSTDSSHNIISNYTDRDSRFREIFTNQSGVSVARNIGIKQAKGKYIRFLDADDRLPKDSIEVLEQAMSNKDVELVIGGFESYPEDVMLYSNKSIQGSVPVEKMLFDFSHKAKTYYYGVNWNKLYKLDIIISNNILFNSEVQWCEDFLFNLEYYEKCKNVYFTQHSVYRYTTNNPNSITNNLENIICSEKINEYRYKCAYNLLQQYGLEKELKNRWELPDMYSNLSEIIRSKESIRIKLQKFKEQMFSQSTNSRLKDQTEEWNYQGDDFVYRLICYSLNKKRCIVLFVFFFVKDALSQHVPLIKKVWKKYKKGTDEGYL